MSTDQLGLDTLAPEPDVADHLPGWWQDPAGLAIRIQVASAVHGAAPHRRARRGPARHIALVGEGAYPVGPGGVSLWCHQLIEGMPEHTFTAVALTVDGTATSVWDPPPNLRDVVQLPLWEATPTRRPRLRAEPPQFARAHDTFVRAVLRPDLDVPSGGGEGAFEVSVREMLEHAPAGRLGDALVSNESVGRLVRAWGELGLDGHGRLTLRDAAVACDRIEHMLRALSHPPVRADVCHLSMGGISVLVALRSKWAYGTPMVLSEHGVYLRERYLALAGEGAPHAVQVVTTRFHRALANAGYRNADVLAPHSTFNRRWQLTGGGDPARMQTMYNGIDPEDFPVADTEPKVPTIVYVGRIDRLKDLHTLIRAFAIVRAGIPNAVLRMFGPVTEESLEYQLSCLELIDELGLRGSAIFEGRIPRTVDAYHAGHLVALTSVSEGFPFTIVESMSVGRPAVATDVGGVSEAVGTAGFVVPPRDHEAVAAACLRLLNDEGLRRRLGSQARQRVLDRFTLAQWTDAYRRIYRDLTEANSDAAGPQPPVATVHTIVLPDTAAALAPVAS